MWSAPENDINTSTLACSCSNSSCPCSYSTTQTASIVAATASLSLLTVLGNALVLLSVALHHRLRTVHNYLVLSLAAADLMVGVASVPLAGVYLVGGRWPLGPLLCDLWLLLDYVASNASVLSLLLICLDRYFCVTRPLSYPARRSGAGAGLMVAGAWMLSLLLWAPPILCWQTLAARRPVPAGRCYIQVLASAPLTLGTALLSFYLPAVVMATLYGRIAAASRSRLPVRPHPRAAARPGPHLQGGMASGVSQTKTPSEGPSHADWRPQEDGSSSSLRRPPRDPGSDTPPWRRGLSRSCSTLARWRGRSRERRVTHAVLAVLLVFIATWLPYNVLAVVGSLCRVCVPDALWAAGYWLCYVNSAINPALYALFNGAFRSSFLHLLRCSRAPP
ncbi:muscarinic acetylcholine receptor M4 [Gadus morhua]|uniref:muscarinic acetylcholine receptor M4 n=1 Tax=Gadus morhua TaxID=8049 RepID=UPI0011B4E941|nr:muscarinic acetylcholine receptor M4-like [Gadus morhua]